MVRSCSGRKKLPQRLDGRWKELWQPVHQESLGKWQCQGSELVDAFYEVVRHRHSTCRIVRALPDLLVDLYLDLSRPVPVKKVPTEILKCLPARFLIKKKRPGACLLQHHCIKLDAKYFLFILGVILCKFNNCLFLSYSD